jgi:hypothetical protein
MSGEPVTNVLLRVPKSLHDKIKALAKTNKHSITEEYISLVEGGITEPDKETVQPVEVKVDA